MYVSDYCCNLQAVSGRSSLHMLIIIATNEHVLCLVGPPEGHYRNDKLLFKCLYLAFGTPCKHIRYIVYVHFLSPFRNLDEHEVDRPEFYLLVC